MTGRLDEEKTTMHASILNVSLSLSCQFLAQIRGMLIFDIFDDGIPARRNKLRSQEHPDNHLPSLIVDLVTIARCVHNVQAQSNPVLFNDCSCSVHVD